MKKLILKIVSAMMLVFGITFASSLAPLQDTSNPFLQSAYADEDDESETTDDTTSEDTSSTESTSTGNNTNEPEDPCSVETDSVAWILCPVMRTAGNLVDAFYGFIEQMLIVQPLSTDEDSAVIQVWRVARDLTNTAFIVFALIVIYSQLTGLGISNYGVKRVLPRLIIAVIMVNLSFFICSVAVDISNIVGSSITGFLDGIQTDILSKADLNYHLDVLWSDFTRALTAGGVVAGVAVAAFAGIKAIFWGVILALIGAVISLGIGLFTISLRQGLILILVMIAPLAFLAYLLPNTEKWFEKWKNLFFQMLFFYPMFSFLFGASKLAGWAIIASAEANLFTVLIGMVVEVAPIFFSFSLFKMSGTILGDINTALQKASAPARGGIAGWATSHQELERQKYLGKSVMPGAHLRRFLDGRKQLREDDTAAAAELRKNRAAERAFNKAASYRGLDSEGNAKVGGHWLFNSYANSHTRLRKQADVQRLLAATAQQNLANNLSDYDKTFKGAAAKRLNSRGAEAYLDNAKQQFRAENIAMGDQSLLLGRYLQAAKGREKSPYEFNRLIGGASSSLGHIGEASIIGQVIDRSVQIENRRRREALVVANKFGYSKSDFRGMILDKARINDDGYEEDENGQVIEDAQYRLLPGKKRRKWGQYVAIHKTTGKEITKEAYLSLNQGQRDEYKTVRYMEIKDDEGDVIQRVYDDDAGYMKELLNQDIAIGDPINRRYETEIGVARLPSQHDRLTAQYASADRTGILRRYHSTIAAALQASKYAEHDASATAMLTAQLNNGNVTSVGQRDIAGLDSLWKAAKAGKILQNDASIIRYWKKVIQSVTSTTPGERFEDFFSDADVALYRNVNGEALHGLRKAYNENGEAYWYKIDRNDASITVEDKKNWIKHKMIPEVARKMLGSMDRNLSSTILDSQKTDATKEFFDFIDVIVELGANNLDDNTPFEQRLDPKQDILDAKSPQAVRSHVRQAKESAYERLGREVPESNAKQRDKRNSRNNDGVPLGNHQSKYGPNRTNAALRRSNAQEEYDEDTNDPLEIRSQVEAIFADNADTNLNVVADLVKDYFRNNSSLIDDYYDQVESIANSYINQYISNASTITDKEFNAELKEDFKRDIIDVTDQLYSD